MSWDTSDIDVYLGSNFTEAQRRVVRKKISAYRKARIASKKKEKQRIKKEKYTQKSFGEENKRIEKTLKEIFGKDDELKPKSYTKRNKANQRASNHQSARKNTPFNLWFNIFLFLCAIFFAIAVLFSSNPVMNGLFILLFLLMGFSIIINLSKGD